MRSELLSDSDETGMKQVRTTKPCIPTWNITMEVGMKLHVRASGCLFSQATL